METAQPSRRIDRPEPGLFKLRFTRGGVFVPAKIIFDHARGLWGAEIDGKPAGPPDADADRAAGVMRVWTSGRRVDADEYAYLAARSAYARVTPGHPAADPGRPVAIHSVPPIF